MKRTVFREIFAQTMHAYPQENRDVAWLSCFEDRNPQNLSHRAMTIYRILAAIGAPRQ